MFMAGLGTGLDPFRAFVEQRKFQKNKGTKVGPQTPFFGGRYSKQEKQKSRAALLQLLEAAGITTTILEDALNLSPLRKREV